MLTLDEVFSKAGKESIAYIRDGDIHYMVLNTKVNAITVEVTDKMNEIIDTVESSKGRGVFVTLSSSKVFCAGFDLQHWNKNPINMHMQL